METANVSITDCYYKYPRVKLNQIVWQTRIYDQNIYIYINFSYLWFPKAIVEAIHSKYSQDNGRENNILLRTTK